MDVLSVFSSSLRGVLEFCYTIRSRVLLHHQSFGVFFCFISPNMRRVLLKSLSPPPHQSICFFGFLGGGKKISGKTRAQISEPSQVIDQFKTDYIFLQRYSVVFFFSFFFFSEKLDENQNLKQMPRQFHPLVGYFFARFCPAP